MKKVKKSFFENPTTIVGSITKNVNDHFKII